MDIPQALMAMQFPSSRADRIHTSIPTPVVLPAIQMPSPAQVAQPSPDVVVDGMETSPSNFTCVGLLRTDSFGDEAGKVHRATLAHVYPTRSNVKKRADVETTVGDVIGTEIFEM